MIVQFLLLCLRKTNTSRHHVPIFFFNFKDNYTDDQQQQHMRQGNDSALFENVRHSVCVVPHTAMHVTERVALHEYH